MAAFTLIVGAVVLVLNEYFDVANESTMIDYDEDNINALRKEEYEKALYPVNKLSFYHDFSNNVLFFHDPSNNVSFYHDNKENTKSTSALGEDNDAKAE